MNEWSTYEIVRVAIEATTLLLLVATGIVAYCFRLERKLSSLEARLAIIPDLLNEWKGIMCDLTEIRAKLGMHNSEGDLARKDRLEKALDKVTRSIPVVDANSGRPSE